MDPTKEELNLWYDSFISGLKAIGISDANPLSLGLVKIYNEFDDAQMGQLNNSDNLEENQQAVDMVKAIYKMPFLKKSEPYGGDDYADYLYDNMGKTSEISDETKLALYNAAKQSKLMIESFDSGTDYSFNAKYVTIKNDGTAFITDNFNKITEDNYADKGLDKETFDRTDIINGLGGSALKNGRGVVTNIINAIDEDYNIKKMHNSANKQELYTKTVEKKKEVDKKNQWLMCEHDMLVEAYYHPSWYENPETRKIRNDVRRFANRSIISDEQKALLNEHNIIFMDITKRLTKYLNAQGLENVNSWEGIKGQQYTTLDGEAFTTDDEYNFYKSICKTFNDGAYIYINGIPSYYNSGGYGIRKCAPTMQYASVIDSLINELDRVDAKDIGDFTAELRNLSNKIRDAKDRNMEFDKIAEMFTAAVTLGNAYRTANGNSSELTGQQRAVLRVINKFNVLHDKARAEDINPVPSADEIILEKLVHGTFISAQKSGDQKKAAFGIKGQLDLEEYKKVRDKIANSSTYKYIINNLSQQGKELMAQKSTKELTENYYRKQVLPFKDANGKRLTISDVNLYKQLYGDIINGYYRCMNETAEYAFDQKLYRRGLERFQTSANELWAHFNDAINADEVRDIEEFFKDELAILYDNVVDTLGKDKQSIKVFEDALGRSFVKDLRGDSDQKDTKKALRDAINSFKLTDNVYDGIEQLDDYDPANVNVHPLDDIRMSNSGTYQAITNSEARDLTKYSFTMGTELSKLMATKIMKKKHIDANDLFNCYATINAKLRSDDVNGGKIRAEEITSDLVKGASPLSLPGHLFETFERIAALTNQIKAAKDPKVQKSQALQLSGFIYPMLISEHVFGDGNGRSTRLFIDSILQAFKLPPHTPTFGMQTLTRTMGIEMDFKRGGNLFFESVKNSDNLMKFSKLNADQIKQIATDFTAEHHIRPSVINEIGGKKSIEMSIQIKGYKLSLADSIDSFISADHIFTKNSDQYNTVIEKAKVLKQTILTEPLNSVKNEKAMGELTEAVKAYETHCRQDVKNNKTREKRVQAASQIKNVLHDMQKAAKGLNLLESRELIRNSQTRQNEIVQNINNENNKQIAICKFVAAKLVETKLSQNPPKMTIEEADELLQFGEKVQNQILKDKDFEKAVKDMLKHPDVNIETREGLEAFANTYVNLKMSNRQVLNQDVAPQQIQLPH